MTTQRGFAQVAMLTVSVALCAIGVRAAGPEPVRGEGMVATDHVLASAAGAEILARGGNAFDAAVAAALAAGVVQPGASGLGGGGFAVWADGTAHGALDFREVAPAAAHRDLYRLADGTIDGTASRAGGLAVAVPGEPRGLARLLAEHGTLSPTQVAAPAVRLAREGFPAGPYLVGGLERSKFADVQALFRIDGVLPAEGEVVRRPDLAKTLIRWARTGGEVLNEGRGAEALVAATRPAGVITTADLTAYTPKERDPIVIPWRGYTVISMAPPSSGGIVLAQVLRALEDQDLAALGVDSPEYVHRVVEAFKHAYADRAAYLGDPDFVEVPVERLLSDERRDAIRASYDPARTFGPEHYGTLLVPPRDAGTQHISVADSHGRAVSLTTTINTSFGSGVVVPGYGVILNDEMDDFAAAPGVPNAFGLIGAEANRIEPGKRPLSSTTPTLVLDGDGAVVLVVGASGGAQIPSSVTQVILDVLVFGMDPLQAVSRPRFHHQWMPQHIEVEPGFPEEVVRALEERGHVVVVKPQYSSVQAVGRFGDDWLGAADPRHRGEPAGSPR